MRRGLITLAVFLALSGVASAESLEGDPRVVAWAWSFAAGDAGGVLKSVEADLASPTPSPLAADIRARVRVTLGLDAEPGDSADDRAARLASVPPERVQNPRQALDLAEDARSLERFDRTGRYTAAAQTLDPEGFRPPAPATPVVEQLSIGRAWLALHPRDSAAWAFTGRQLMTLERYDEAAQAFARADALYPFAADGHMRAVALIRLGRMEDARTLIQDTIAHLVSAGEPARRRTLHELATALLDAGELGRARALLADTGADVRLLTDFGRLELASNRPAEAIGPLQRAVALPHAPAQARILLVRAWTAAGKPVRGWQSFKDLRGKAPLTDPAWAAAGIEALETLGDHANADELADEALSVNPNSPRLLHLRALTLAGLGAPSRAANWAAKAEAAAPPSPPAVAEAETLGGQACAQAAASVLQAWNCAQIRADDIAATDRLFQPEFRAVLGTPRVFARLNDLADRNPFDPRRQTVALDRHAGPGGSPVLAMAHALALERISDGRHAREVRTQVINRLAAIGRIADLDLKENRIVLERPDGSRLEAVYHPLSGRLIRLADRGVTRAAHWDPAGIRLNDLTGGTGGQLSVTWNGPRVTVLEKTGPDAFRAELGGDGTVQNIVTQLRPEAAQAAYNAAVQAIAAWAEGDLERLQ